MSKLTALGVAGAAVLVAVAVPALTSADASDITLHAAATSTHPASSSGPAADAPGAGKATVAPARSVSAKTPEKKPVTGKASAKVALLTPLPAGSTPSPDPRSAACRAHPATEFCDVGSTRFVTPGSIEKAHASWLPALTRWGLTDVTDTCADQPVQARAMCVLKGNHGSSAVTVLFKRLYDVTHSPAAVKARTDAIHQQAITAVMKARTPAQQASILKAAAAQAAKLQKAADSYNAAHLATTVNVVVAPR